MPTTTRTVLFHEVGGPEVLKIEDVSIAGQPGPGEVALRIEALGLNRADALFRAGTYYYQPTLPGSRLGYEASAVVEAVGEGVTELAVGDPVMTGPGIEMGAQGVYAERVVLPESAVVRRPASVDPVTGAAAWLTYTTAYGALLETAGLRPGDHVLITAGSSGVGTAAIQVSRRIGAVPVVTTRTEEKRKQLLDLGAAEVIVTGDAGTEPIAEEVRRLTGGRGAEVIFDAIGGPGFGGLAAALAEGGSVVVYGWLDGRPTEIPFNWPFTIHTYANMALTTTPDGRRRSTAFLNAGLTDGGFRPPVAEVFEGLETIQKAHHLMETNRHTGKIVVRL
ncbi:alcohol dehydrogenase zinc-binding domain-containing protein [Streptomyces davaonensis JCM 4913]|uniref:Alcohol dehydrogenase zinc-binding domain-containing protein n=1 Tax=Streptomyces davaonensis (strain DSM 101723 / JCM 4913 / KCC S-0913 / 768) TaxID=1214101 RepID=K4R3S6_STRDJ|nr:zinc-dependent alcohol dehydrogenase family protein [Streptomyces davaonensis]CCK27319.1 alcohol dehydrogenase zinc-binding domain-containing protein [Streptomyces davaonensis JCM 4913]